MAGPPEEARAPQALRSGDRVAVISTSGPVPDDRLDAGLDVLRGWGLEVVEGRTARATHPRLEHLAATDADRVADFTAAWTDPAIAAAMVGRGGFGVQRFLDLLDLDALAAAGPKTLVGFSDLTPLLALVASIGGRAIHGPVVAKLGDGDEESRARVRDLLFEPDRVDVLFDGLTSLTAGEAVGPLAGGNLTMLATSADLRGGEPVDGAIVLIEDVFEFPHRIDRELTVLRRRGWLDAAAAIVLGDFTDCGDPDQVHEVLVDRLGGLGIPVWAGAAFGHEDRNLAFPIGATAYLGGGVLSLRPQAASNG